MIYNDLLAIWALISIPLILVGLYTKSWLKNLSNFCDSRVAGLEAYRKAYDKRRKGHSLTGIINIIPVETGTSSSFQKEKIQTMR